MNPENTCRAYKREKKMHTCQKVFFAALIILLTVISAAAVTNVGSRAISLGDSYTAVADDSSAIYWNPGGLTQLNRMELGIFNVSHNNENNLYTSFAYPDEKHGFFCAAVGNHVNFTELIQTTTYYTDSENYVSVSYARQVSRRLSAGITLNSISRSRLGLSDSGMTADIGFFYKPLKNIALGLSGKNVLNPGLLDYGGDPSGGSAYDVPWRWRLALTYYFQVWRQKLPLEKLLKIKKVKSTSLSPEELLLTIELEKSEFSDTLIMYRGLELWLHDILAFRLGPSPERFEYGNTWNALFGIQDPVIGLGLKLSNLRFDISYGRPEYPFSVQLTYNFGRNIEKLEYNRWEIEKRAQQYYKTGEMLYEGGKFAQALAEWEKALIWMPDNDELRKKIESVENELEVVTNKRLIENHINQAYIKYEEGDLLQSLANWQKILEIDPGHTRAQEYVDKINSKLTETEKRRFREEQETKQRERIAKHMRTADIYFENGKYAMAIREWQKALKLKPSHAEARENIKRAEGRIQDLINLYYDRGMDYLEQADTGAAIREFRKVLELDPDNEKTKEQVEKLKKKKKPAKIIELKEVEVDTKEINQMYYRGADFYLAGNYREAEKTLNGLLAIDPFNENAIMLLEKIKSVMETLGE